MARRKSATAKRPKKPAAVRKPAPPSYFDAAQLMLRVEQAREAQRVPPVQRGSDTRELRAVEQGITPATGRVPPAFRQWGHVGPTGATTLLYEPCTHHRPGKNRWVVVISPDRTSAFAFSAMHDGQETQRLTHWAVAWSERPRKDSMWVGQWGRLARRKGTRELLERGALCKVCRTRDPDMCEAIQRAQSALDHALRSIHG